MQTACLYNQIYLKPELLILRFQRKFLIQHETHLNLQILSIDNLWSPANEASVSSAIKHTSKVCLYAAVTISLFTSFNIHIPANFFNLLLLLFIFLQPLHIQRPMVYHYLRSKVSVTLNRRPLYCFIGPFFVYIIITRTQF